MSKWFKVLRNSKQARVFGNPDFLKVANCLQSCLVLSCLVLSCLVLSCLVLSCLVLSCLVLSCLVLSCLVLSCLVSSLSFSVFFLGLDGLEVLQSRLEQAVGQVKATTMVSRNKKKFAVPDEIERLSQGKDVDSVAICAQMAPSFLQRWCLGFPLSPLLRLLFLYFDTCGMATTSGDEDSSRLVCLSSSLLERTSSWST